MLDEHFFDSVAEKTLEDMADALEEADESGTLEVEFSSGILSIALDDEREYVINKHLASRQIWLASPESGAHYFMYNEEDQTWETDEGENLHEILATELHDLAEIEVEF